MLKDELREEIACLTRDFISRGGEVEQVPLKRFLGKNYEWLRQYDMDYMPWEDFGGSANGIFLTGGNSFPLGDGCHMSRNLSTEE